jgi:hypothetical protein
VLAARIVFLRLAEPEAAGRPSQLDLRHYPEMKISTMSISIAVMISPPSTTGDGAAAKTR